MGDNTDIQPNSNNEFVVVYNHDPSKAKEKQVQISDKVTEAKKNQIVKNQVEPFVRRNLEVNRSSAFSTTCQHCQQKVMTQSIQTFNKCTCLFCCCTGIVIYAVIQLIRGKDICCYDAEHRCPNCKETIALYDSCC